MPEVGIKELLEAGVHFGHQTRRWNPKMRRYIYGERDGIYIIDLLRTEALLRQAQEFVSQIAHRGGIVLFVGTKKQARDAVKDAAERAGMPYVNNRWLGGLLTNFQTINQRIKRLHDLERYQTEGQLELLPTRERLAALADLEKLQANLGGVKHMQRAPDALFVIDLKTEEIAVREAQRLRIPIIGLVDTNCDPGRDRLRDPRQRRRDPLVQGHRRRDRRRRRRGPPDVPRLAEEEKARAEAEEKRAPRGRGARPPRGRGRRGRRGRGGAGRGRGAPQAGARAGRRGRPAAEAAAPEPARRRPPAPAPRRGPAPAARLRRAGGRRARGRGAAPRLRRPPPPSRPPPRPPPRPPSRRRAGGEPQAEAPQSDPGGDHA